MHDQIPDFEAYALTANQEARTHALTTADTHPTPNASHREPRAPRARTQHRPGNPAHPVGEAGACHCRRPYPILLVDFTHSDPWPVLRHDPGLCGLPTTPTTLETTP